MNIVHDKPVIKGDKETGGAILTVEKNVTEYFTEEQLRSYVQRAKNENARNKMRYWKKKQKDLKKRNEIGSDE